MKLKKVTQSQIATETGPGANRRRWYDDACGTALALELVGERWSLLIVRELMFGGRRFGELKAALPGISANILTQRLEGLEQSGILVRHKLPPPVSVQVYELTEWGYESETAIQELGRWAVRSPRHDPSLPLSAASLMMSFRTMYGGGLNAAIGFRIGEDRFVAEASLREIAIRRGDPDRALAVFSGTPMAIAGLVYGRRPIADAESAGDVTVTGNRALAERFVTRFPLPSKLGPESDHGQPHR